MSHKVGDALTDGSKYHPIVMCIRSSTKYKLIVQQRTEYQDANSIHVAY